MNVWSFIVEHRDKMLQLTIQHVHVVAVSVVLATILGVLIGIFITRNKRLADSVLYVAGIIMTIPSIAMFGILIPIVGIGFTPAVIALVLYGQLPIIRNTYTAITGVDPAIIEAGRGMGMTERQLMLRIRLPLATPVILAGVRTAVVMNVGIAAIAAYIGAGGLGKYIFWGISRTWDQMVVAGAIGVSVIAILADWILGRLEKRLVPRGIRE